ncbi:lipoprotein 17-related variable surface protein, partial [Mycoplasma bradburyae]|uniref:lipoprotein 17-related variable surface protein n=1 Tax=Mycoplasma bradburyae TaxID=2963128 RepID=UPI00233FEA68
QPINEKPARPSDPKNPDNGDGNSTVNQGSGSGDNSSMNSNSDSNSLNGKGDSSNSNSIISTNSKAEIEAYAKTLMADNFKIVNTSGNEISKDNIKASEITKENIKLKESNPATKGWTLDVELVSNSDSENTDNDNVKFKIKFSKDNDEVTSNEIIITGFKTLKTSVSKALLKNMIVKDQSGQDVSKNVLNLGSAGFKTLVELNKQVLINTSNGDSVSTSSVNSGSEARVNIVEVSENSETQPTVTKDTTNGLNNLFKTIITKEEVEYKANLSKIKEEYDDFDPEKLYLSGDAKLVNLWKNADDWHGNYYLTSKEENNKLSIKYKDKDWSINLTDGLFLQDLLPDDVKISIGAIDVPDIHFDPKMQSNLEAYKTKKMTESTTNQNQTSYQYDDSTKKLSIKLDDNKIVDINPLKLPHVDSGKIDKIYFRSKYVFDGEQMEDGDIFGTKLVFKKIFVQSEFNNDALSSNELKQTYNGLSVIPNRWTGDDVSQWKISPLTGNFTIGNKSTTNITNQFFSLMDNSTGFENSIHGNENKGNNKGVVQLYNNPASNFVTSIYGSRIHITKIENSNSTTFITFSRISYKKDQNTFSYFWPNSVSILRFSGPVSS